jgi:DNA-binding response OmpR family regulator
VARVLCCDDDPLLLDFVSRVLAQKGHVVAAYKDGQEALDAIMGAREGARAEIVVSDVQMPRLDGISLTKALRKVFDKAQLPLVLVSVLEAEDDILRGFEAGANDYLVKPYRAAQLQAKVAVLLKERELLTPALPVMIDEAQTRISSAPSASVVPNDAEPPFTLDKYEAQAVLGRGGMGTVYRALEKGTGRAVALKLLAPVVAADRAGLARFFREAATLARIESPYVVRAIDSGLDRGRYFLVMELAPGRSAKALLVANGPLPPRDAALIGRDVALALAALGERGLIHRDVKPSNIIVSPEGHATLVDFGLARAVRDQDLTGTGEAIGTPHYIAPEVLRGVRCDMRSDLYSLGGTLFELLTGRKPHPGATAFDVYQHLFAAARVELAKSAPEVPKDLARIVDALLDVTPENRPDSPALVAELLERASDSA